ncbi:SRPBCC family protein [Stratiformator vulcanicus]|uniref:Activator of Hsp90 ATPase homologue 1/2-like C-terminal domain-containing protein n=1 Tax=Stratiformator vulcanicus TaxID=2527980 RepID=A0A517R3I9_9PLAN|nr:SRPBCC family protein [Stratiformator vulcanicus]QDT38452.1 hypothetical protein Pan189_28460 [Stratiformator vulcanicus]
MSVPAAGRSETDELTLRMERTFDAPRELVWAAWTQREHISKWWCPEDFKVTSAQNDCTPGGSWRCGMQSPEGEQHVCGGVYRAVVPPLRLIFTMAWEDEHGELDQATTATVTFEEVGDQTLMKFEQTGFASTHVRNEHHDGWSGAFENLKYLLSRTLLLTRNFDAPRELLYEVWTKPEHQVHWCVPLDYEIISCEDDARAGGTYRCGIRAADGNEYWMSGCYQEVVPREKLVSTFALEDEQGRPGHESIVTVRFEDHDGGTRLTFLQMLFENAAGRDAHHKGMLSTFVKLESYLGRLRVTA